MIASVSAPVLGWLGLIQIWILVLWYTRKSAFARRLDQFLELLLAETESVAGRPTSAEGKGTFRRLVGSSRLGQVKWSARRCRTSRSSGTT